MDGVVDIEEVLHFPRAPFAVIQGDEGDGCHRKPLDTTPGQVEDGQACDEIL